MRPPEFGPILRAASRQRSAFLLVILEVALGFAVVSILIWVGTWYRSRGTADPGFPTSELISVASLGAAEPLDSADRRAQDEQGAMLSLPGVLQVATISSDVFDRRWRSGLPLGPTPHPGSAASGNNGWVIDGSPALPQVLGLRFAAGRAPHDTATEEEVAVSESLAADLSSTGSAVGHALWMADSQSPARVVGVFRDVALVIPFLANAERIVLRLRPPTNERGTRFLVRTQPGARDAVTERLRTALRALDPERAYDVRPYDLSAARHVQVSRGLLITLGIIAVVLAAVALIGSLAITAFLVAQRRRQVGIRRALGATPYDVVRLFLVENALAVSLGCILGLLISLSYYFSFNDMFPGVRVTWKQFAFTAALFYIDGLLATLVPALRAARVPPTVASRAL
ncbi:MAG: ABC transporter permease [Myxococcales bacterium]|nr:ABC transporter permease [Myxococcales bacterium]